MLFGRIGAGRKVTLGAGLGLALVLGIGAVASAGEGRSRGRVEDAYLLNRGAEHGSTSTNLSLEEMVELRKWGSGEFLWVRRGGKKFLIRDRAVLEQAQALFEPLQGLDPEREALQAREQLIEREEAALEREMEEIAARAEGVEDDHGEKADAIRAEARRQEDGLRPRLKRLEARERELNAAERSLDEREEAIERKVEERLWVLIDATLARGLGERLDAR